MIVQRSIRRAVFRHPVVTGMAALVLTAVVAPPAHAATSAGEGGGTSLHLSPGVSVDEQMPVAIARGMVVRGGPIRRAVVTLSDGAAPEDQLSFRDRRRIKGAVKGGRLVLTGRASAARYERALRTVRFVHTGDAPQPGRVVDFVVVSARGQTVRESKRLYVRPSNDAPQVELSPDATAVQVGSMAVPIGDGLRVTDVVNRPGFRGGSVSWIRPR